MPALPGEADGTKLGKDGLVPCGEHGTTRGSTSNLSEADEINFNEKITQFFRHSVCLEFRTGGGRVTSSGSRFCRCSISGAARSTRTGSRRPYQTAIMLYECICTRVPTIQISHRTERMPDSFAEVCAWESEIWSEFCHQVQV